MLRSAVLGLGLLVLAVPAMAEGDAVKGKAVYAKCMVCHDLKPGVNRLGPSMAGIVGRQSATVAGFNYSPAMKKLNIKWDEAKMDTFLEKPMKMVPGNRMAFVGLPKPEDRANVIAYIKANAK